MFTCAAFALKRVMKCVRHTKKASQCLAGSIYDDGGDYFLGIFVPTLPVVGFTLPFALKLFFCVLSGVVFL